MASKTKKIYISGMTCASCEIIIKDELQEIEGIEEIRISHKKKSADIVYNTEKLPFNEIVLEVRKVGYEASLEPIKKGTLWCNLDGLIDITLSLPVVANPPACSAMKAKGLHSYNKRSFPSGSTVVSG